MSGAKEKEARERLMFGGFAAQSGLDIDHASITSCSPPLADIRCTINGSTYFFELAEVVVQEQAQALATKGVYTSGFPDPEEKGPKRDGSHHPAETNEDIHDRWRSCRPPPVLQ